MATCTRQVVITFDGPLITFVFDTGHRTSVFICCCENCVSISSDAQFLFVAGYIFHKSCITSVDGNASGNLVTYLGLIKDQIVTACAGGVAFDEDYQAVLDRGTAQVFTLPSAPQQILQNQLVLDLKASGIWTNLDLFYVFANDGSDDFSRINWIAPATFELVEVNAPTWTADQGWQGDGATEYLDTGWDAPTDGVNYVRNAASLGIWIRISGSATNIHLGTRASGGDAAYLADFTGTADVGSIINANEAGRIDTAQATGFLHGNRSAAGAHQQFLNGAPSANAQASVVLNTSDYLVLAAGRSPLAPAFHSDGQVSIAAVGGDLLTEGPDFFTDVNTYMSAI